MKSSRQWYKCSNKATRGEKFQSRKKSPKWYSFERHAKLNSVEHMACNVYEVDEPNTLKEGLESKYAKEWKKAADQEFKSLCDMQRCARVQVG